MTTDAPYEGRLTFVTETRLEASRAAAECCDLILDRADEDEVKAEVVRDDPSTMDGGATVLVAFLTSSAALAIARGIQAWLAKRPGDSDTVVVTGADGSSVRLTGRAAAEASPEAIIRALTQAKKKTSSR